MLAHVIEAAGIATVCLSSVRGQTERVKPPRALHCEFPLGRPLGRPRDPDFQHAVLRAAFDLLAAPGVPVLVDYPEVIRDDPQGQLACPLPPRHDAGIHPAADEAAGLRAAFDRAADRGASAGFGKKLSPEQVPAALEAFARIAGGTPFEKAEIPGGDILAAAHDIRCYYEQAAMSLVDHVPAARQTEAWIFQATEAGKILRGAARAMKEAGVPQPLWFYLLPSTQLG